MKLVLILAQALCAISICWAQTPTPQARLEAEYYVTTYAQHYRVPVALVRAIVERESHWRACAVSPKGAAGLMQLMPLTAQRLGVRDRCRVDQNVSGGVRYLAWLMQQFHNDLRLVAAAYYAGEDVVRRRDLAYRNPDVIAYVAKIFPHGSVLSSSPYTNSFSPVSITLFPTPANLLAASISTTS